MKNLYYDLESRFWQALRFLKCILGLHEYYTCNPECCGQTLCVWCEKVKD